MLPHASRLARASAASQSREPRRSDSKFIDGVEKLVGTAVDPEGSSREQLVLAVAAGEQADAEHPRAPCGEQVPDRIADDKAVSDLDAKALLAGQEQVGLGLGPEHVAALDDDHLGRHAEGLE